MGPPVSNVHDSSSSSSSSAVAAAAALQAAMQVIKYMLTLQSFKYLVVCFLTFSKRCQSDWYYFIVFLRCCLLRSTRRIKMLRGGSLPCACLRFVQSHIITVDTIWNIGETGDIHRYPGSDILFVGWAQKCLKKFVGAKKFVQKAWHAKFNFRKPCIKANWILHTTLSTIIGIYRRF